MRKTRILLLIISVSLLTACSKTSSVDNSKSSDTDPITASQNINLKKEDNLHNSTSENTKEIKSNSDTIKSNNNNNNNDDDDNDLNNFEENNTKVVKANNSSTDMNENADINTNTKKANAKNSIEKDNTISDSNDADTDENINIKNDSSSNNPDIKIKNDEDINAENTIERKEVSMKVLTDSQIPSNFLNKIKRIRESKGYITSNDSNYFYIAILGGEKPSSGYKIKVLDAYSENDNLIINIEQISPPPKTNVLTVLTYPYTVISLDKNYTNITIKDNFGVEFNPIVFGEAS